MIRGICGVPALFLGLVVVLVPAERPAIASSGPSFNIVATAPTRTSQIRLSADGSTVAFTDTSTGDELPFRWRPDTGLTPLPFEGDTWINGISHDGSLVLGAGGPGKSSTFRWSEAGGVQQLNFEQPAGHGAGSWAMSADGSTVVGYTSGPQLAWFESFRWRDGQGPADRFASSLGDSGKPSVATGVSADGSAVAGRYGDDVYRWTAAGGVQVLWQGAANDPRISGDGLVVAVSRADAVSQQWSARGGVQDLVTPAGWNRALVSAMNGSGSLISGVLRQPTNAGADLEGVVWGNAGQPQLLKDYLAARGVDVSQWTSLTPLSISDDGQTFAGYGIDSAGQGHVWVASVPEPSAALLLGLSCGWLLRRRRA
jgi:hypothetical protein